MMDRPDKVHMDSDSADGQDKQLHNVFFKLKNKEQWERMPMMPLF